MADKTKEVEGDVSSNQSKTKETLSQVEKFLKVKSMTDTERNWFTKQFEGVAEESITKDILEAKLNELK